MRELIIAGSGWKGALRNAFRAVHGDGTPQETQLFGPAKLSQEDEDELEGASRGRLMFCPTYILPAPGHTGLRVINPHSREKKIGLNPIVYEVIKLGRDCTFGLLYVPWGRGSKATPEQRSEDGSDIRMTGEALRAMFRDLGAGGKTTSGFGTFSVRDGKLATQEKPYPFTSMKKLVDAFAKASGGPNVP
jgi:CRISPR-associated protein Cmr2